MKSVQIKIEKIDEKNECAIDFYRLSIQSISLKSDLPIFIDLSIDKSIPIFIDLLLRVIRI